MGIDSAYELRTQKSQDCSVPRRLKPFIKHVSLVCPTWNRIALWKINPHFWVTILMLSFGSSLEQPELRYAHRVKMVTTFRQVLRTAQGSDIRLWWSHYAEKSRDDQITWTRIFTHCISDLSNYSNQLSSVYFTAVFTKRVVAVFVGVRTRRTASSPSKILILPTRVAKTPHLSGIIVLSPYYYLKSLEAVRDCSRGPSR